MLLPFVQHDVLLQRNAGTCNSLINQFKQNCNQINDFSTKKYYLKDDYNQIKDEIDGVGYPEVNSLLSKDKW